MSASSPELPATNGSWLGKDAPGWGNRYICTRGAMPSGGVIMLALLTWLPSGRPPAVLAPSRALPCTASPSTASKLPAARVKPIGAFWRWSWYVPRKKYIWVASWLAFFCHEYATFGSQEQGNFGGHDGPVNGWKGELNCRVPVGATSSPASARLLSFRSRKTCATLPASRGELLGSHPGEVRLRVSWTPP